MFDWFKKDKETNKVVPFPGNQTPYVVTPVPEKEEPALVFYRLGVTDKNRLAIQVGYSELTMSRQGVQNLIDQLEIFKSQLQDEE
jgi:hypothetical protein